MYSEGMIGTNPQMDITRAPHGPFQNLLGVLETRIKHKDWAPNDMSSLQVMVIMEGSGCK